MIGADDNGKLDGQTFTDEQLRSYSGLRNTGTILPPPAMMVYKETFPEGEIAVIEVQPSEDIPVRYKGVIYAVYAYWLCMSNLPQIVNIWLTDFYE